MSITAAQIEWVPEKHMVQFYELDDELETSVARYFLDGLSAGGSAICIATPEHRAGVESALFRMGIGPDDPRVIWLDAAETLATFMVDGRVDRERFRRIVGRTVRGAVEAGGPVHAFGEMVALLWRPGDVLGAIQLEELWNELGDELDFKLLCGYPSSSLAEPEHAHSIDHVCRLHTMVRQPSSRRFERAPDAPRAARQFVTELLGRWGQDETVVEDAQLVISELVTNAILHTASEFAILASPEDRGVRLEVRDESAAAPEIQWPAPRVPTGRGLQVIDAIASAWGVETTPRGKTVWAVLTA
jgi:anti-sigma regulatory factor (Ser/Thr protein kinase)